MKSIFFSVLALVTTWILPTELDKQQPRNESPFPAAETCPDAHAWTGKYRNFSFGFSIVIPEGYKGFWNSARCTSDAEGCTCMPDHGRIIPLSAEPNKQEHHVEVFASRGADEPTVAHAVTQHLRWVRKRSEKQSMTIRKRMNLTVDGWPGRRVTVRYLDKDTKTWLVEDFVELLKDDNEYSLYLRTPSKHYEQDKLIFEAVLTSLKFYNPEEQSDEVAK